jgi:hypothetical protein
MAAVSEASNSNSSSSSSSSSAEQVKWGYLLHLLHWNPRWTAAVAAFDAKWPGFEDLPAAALRDHSKTVCRSVR